MFLNEYLSHPTYVTLGSFLVFTLVLGFWAGRGVKTLSDFVLADRSLNLGVLTISFIATFISTGSLAHTFLIHDYGIFTLLTPLCFFTCFLLVGYFVAPHAVKFANCMTTGDLISRLYGKYAGVLAGLVSFIFCFFVVSAQLKGLGFFFKYMLGVKLKTSILIFGSVITFYSVVGMPSVVVTDLGQFVALVVALTVIANALVDKQEGLQSLWGKIPDNKLFTNAKFIQPLKIALWQGLLPTYVLSPPIVQRMLMIKNRQKSKYMFIICGIFFLAIHLILSLIGLGGTGLAEKPASSKNLVGYLIKHLFADNKISQALLIAGIVSVMMSSADSFLHAASISLVHDIIAPLSKGFGININEIQWMKWSMWLISVCATYFAISTRKGIYSTIAGYKIAIQGLILIPLIAGLIGLKSAARSFWFFVGAFMSSMTLIPYLITSADRPVQVLLSYGMATLIFLLTHYLTYGGFVMARHTNEGLLTKKWRIKTRSWSQVLALFPTPAKLVRWSRDNVMNYGSEPLRFSLFIMLLFMIPSTTGHGQSILAFNLLRALGVLLCVGLMVESSWSKNLQPYFHLYWFVTVLYCVPFLSTLQFFNDHESPAATIYMSISLLLLIVLVEWKIFILLSLIGIGAALPVYKWLISPHSYYWPVFDFHLKWNLSLGVSAALVVGLVFARRQSSKLLYYRIYNRYLKEVQRHMSKELLDSLHMQQRFTNSLQKNVRDKLKAIKKLRQDIVNGKISPEALREAAKSIKESLDYLYELLYRVKSDFKVNIQPVALQKMIQKVSDTLSQKYTKDLPNIMLQYHSNHKTLHCDQPYMHTLLCTALEDMHKQHPNKTIIWRLDDTQLSYTSADNTRKQVPALRFVLTNKTVCPPLGNMYMASLPSQDLPLKKPLQSPIYEANKIIIQAHCGFLTQQITKDTITQIYVLPVHSVR